jgi:hypothetical protein
VFALAAVWAVLVFFGGTPLILPHRLVMLLFAAGFAWAAVAIWRG